MPHRRGNPVRNHCFDYPQEKDLGIYRSVAGDGCSSLGRFKRTDQREPAQRTCNRPGLVLARYVFDGTHTCQWKDSGPSIPNKEHSETSGLWMWSTSCPLISQSRFCLFWFYCPLPKLLNIWAFRFFNTLSLEYLGFYSFC